jgi:putative transposase
MPWTVRASQAGFCDHVSSRGIARSEVVLEADDDSAFLKTLTESSVRVPVRLLADCLMPNHFPLVSRPHGDGDRSRGMQWLMTTTSDDR